MSSKPLILGREAWKLIGWAYWGQKSRNIVSGFGNQTDALTYLYNRNTEKLMSSTSHVLSLSFLWNLQVGWINRSGAQRRDWNWRHEFGNHQHPGGFWRWFWESSWDYPETVCRRQVVSLRYSHEERQHLSCSGRRNQQRRLNKLKESDQRGRKTIRFLANSKWFGERKVSPVECSWKIEWNNEWSIHGVSHPVGRAPSVVGADARSEWVKEWVGGVNT